MPGEKYSSYQVGGGGWRQLVMNRARRYSDRISNFIDNDFDTDALATGGTTGSGTVTYDTGETGGVVRLRTGSLIIVTSTAGVNNAGGSTLVASPLDQSWCAHARCWIRNTAGANSNFNCIVLQDAGSQFVGFGLFGMHSTTFLGLLMDNGGGPVFTASPMPADTSGFRDYAIVRDVEDDKIFVLVDDDPVLSLDGPFTDLTSNPCFMYSAVSDVGNDIEQWVDNIVAVTERA